MARRSEEETLQPGLGGSVEALELVPGYIVGGTYRIQSKLGLGAMGVVYRAQDIKLYRSVALKFLNPVIADSPEVVGLFRSEAQALARLNHPNIVQVYAFGEESGWLYFAMELLTGHTLAKVIAAEGRMRAARAAPILRQICEALEVSHGNGMVHRDLKPANVMILANDHVKVMDFGLAGVAASATGRAIGTPRYMAPEQALGLRVDARADLYSLGIIMYELFVGDVPFEGENYRKTLEMQVHSPVPSARKRRPDVPREWDFLIRDLLAKRPEERPSSATEVIRRIDALMGTGDDTALNRPVVDPEAEADRLYQKARAHFEIGEYKAARDLLEEVFYRKKKHPRAWNLRGALELKNGTLSEASRSFAKALSLDPDFYEAAKNLGQALQKQGRHEEAVWAFEQALRLMPSIAAPWISLGESRLALRDLPGARKAWERALELDPNNHTLRNRYAKLKKAMAL
ncbi:MAG: serine/threonine-protein kinase [Candidatus Hydrogenedentota bacterium]|nr:MAG: serine/threonine-protein kinase [Candidatus Hydrogenedentota bacterium]